MEDGRGLEDRAVAAAVPTASDGPELTLEAGERIRLRVGRVEHVVRALEGGGVVVEPAPVPPPPVAEPSPLSDGVIEPGRDEA